MNADEALQLLYDECDHYLDAVLAVRAEFDRLRDLAGTWEMAALAAISERLDPETAARVGDRMRAIVAERTQRKGALS